MNSLIMAIAGACLYRWRGHASQYKKYFPRPLNQIAFALPYAYITYIHTGIIVSLLILVLTTLAVLSGHGNFFRNNINPKDREPERLEFIIRWAVDKIPLRLYKFLGMVITGMAVTLPAAIAIGSIPLALSGALKGLAYQFNTEVGEYLTGLFLWGVLAVILFL